MADNSTVARPYAKAVHELAQEQGDPAAWSALLSSAADVVQDPSFNALMNSPQATAARLTELISQVCDEEAGALGRNFIAVLAENRRLDCLPAIAAEYDKLRAEMENVIDVELISAVPLTEAQQASYAEALKKKLGKEIRLHCSTDEALLGGAVIRAGDMLIDGSLSGRLARLASAVTH